MDELHSYLDIAELAGKFLKGEITREESILLDAWIANSDRNKALWKNLTCREYLERQLDRWEDQHSEAAWKELLPAIRSASSTGASSIDAYPIDASPIDISPIDVSPIDASPIVSGSTDRHT